ncbi:NUDIX domain-containing protein [Amorphus sp. 3PC139-8]|uniref:NUDIX domain-containing protein n=1 Tax=Amorphus sp. 3PC139-8 TaxID=2735676 RepID=UPI00345CCF3C
MHFPPNRRTATIVASSRIHDGYVKLDEVQLRVERPGRATQEYERDIHHHGHAATVLPYDRSRKTVVVVRQLRVPLLVIGDPDPYLVEACAGIIDPEDKDAQSACLRESQEEIGLKLRTLEPAGLVYPCPSCVTEHISLFLAPYTPEDRISDGGGADEDEDIDVIELPIAELIRMLDAGEIRDAKLLMLTQALLRAHPELAAD